MTALSIMIWGARRAIHPAVLSPPLPSALDPHARFAPPLFFCRPLTILPALLPRNSQPHPRPVGQTEEEETWRRRDEESMTMMMMIHQYRSRHCLYEVKDKSYEASY